MMERQHQRIMEQMAKDADMQRTSGFFNNVNMMHQYGAGDQDVLLMSNPVWSRSRSGGRLSGRCSVKQYDISAINVEIS